MNISEIVTQVFLIGLSLQFNSMCANFALPFCDVPPLQSTFLVATQRMRTKKKLVYFQRKTQFLWENQLCSAIELFGSRMMSQLIEIYLLL